MLVLMSFPSCFAAQYAVACMPLLHRNMETGPAQFLKAIAPYREDLVVAVECIFTWYWLADLCTREGIPFGLVMRST